MRPNRIKQLPRIQVRAPTLVTQLDNPASINVQWSTEWKRWDGRCFCTSAPMRLESSPPLR